MGGGVPRGGPPNQTAYFVALGSILFLLALLCCYFCYYFVTKVKELSQQESLSETGAAPRRGPGAAPAAYPVQPVIRDSATAMAALCKLPPVPAAGAGAGAAGRGGTVHPLATSPAALRVRTEAGGTPPPPPPPPVADKPPPPAPAALLAPVAVEAAR